MTNADCIAHTNRCPVSTVEVLKSPMMPSLEASPTLPSSTSRLVLFRKPFTDILMKDSRKVTLVAAYALPFSFVSLTS
jgi:hypothetical protein